MSVAQLPFVEAVIRDLFDFACTAMSGPGVFVR